MGIREGPVTHTHPLWSWVKYVENILMYLENW